MICEVLKLNKKAIWSQNCKVIAFLAKHNPVTQIIERSELTELLWKDLPEAQNARYGKIFRHQNNGKTIFALVLDMPSNILNPEHLIKKINQLEIPETEKILFVVKPEKSKLFTMNFEKLKEGLALSNKKIILCEI